jgi:hypothetical protein
MQKHQLLIIAAKPIILWSSALYLLGFSFNGVNVIGKIDFLIPYERTLCFALSMILFCWCVYSTVAIKKLGEKRKA